MVALRTFANLTEKRQQEIIRICLSEFAINDYQSASLTSIIKSLSLAKGSFYRYFENKQSLYFYLLDYCIQKRILNDQEVIGEPSQDFFESVFQHFKAKLSFDKNQPLCSAFLHNALLEKNSDELGNIQFIRKQKALDILMKLVTQFSENGQLRSDIDKQIIAWSILSTQLSIVDFIEHKYQLDFRQNIRAHRRLYDLPEEELLRMAKEFIDIQRHGIKNGES